MFWISSLNRSSLPSLSSTPWKNPSTKYINIVKTRSWLGKIMFAWCTADKVNLSYITSCIHTCGTKWIGICLWNIWTCFNVKIYIPIYRYRVSVYPSLYHKSRYKTTWVEQEINLHNDTYINVLRFRDWWLLIK